jgi:hypothetical protein
MNQDIDIPQAAMTSRESDIHPANQYMERQLPHSKNDQIIVFQNVS